MKDIVIFISSTPCGHACAFGHVDEAVSGGNSHAGKGVVGLLS